MYSITQVFIANFCDSVAYWWQCNARIFRQPKYEHHVYMLVSTGTYKQISYIKSSTPVTPQQETWMNVRFCTFPTCRSGHRIPPCRRRLASGWLRSLSVLKDTADGGETWVTVETILATALHQRLRLPHQSYVNVSCYTCIGVAIHCWL